MTDTLTLSNYWLEKIVIDLNLCPFAKIPFEKGLIRLVECTDSEETGQVDFFINELERLNEMPADELSTTLVVYPHGSQNFRDFNDFVGDLEFMLQEVSLDSVYQLVAFHPDFVFESLDFNDLGNYVNRSPYPTLHILRSEELRRAIKDPKEGELISFNNHKLLQTLSPEAINQIFYYLKK